MANYIFKAPAEKRFVHPSISFKEFCHTIYYVMTKKQTKVFKKAVRRNSDAWEKHSAQMQKELDLERARRRAMERNR